MKTVANVVEVVVASVGVRTVEEIEAFVMDKANGVTIPRLDAALVELGVPFKKRAVKAEKANLFAHAMQDVVITTPAAGETPVADNKSKEESAVKEELHVPVGYTKEQWENNMRMLDRVDLTKSTLKGEKKETAPSTSANQLLAIEQVNRFMHRLGEHKAMVINIIPFENPDEYGRIGYVDVLLPSGYAEVKIWDDEDKVFGWYDFTDFNMNQLKPRMPFSGAFPASGMEYNLEFGSGIIRLAIKENADGEVRVGLPKDKDRKQENVFYDVLRTSDIRYYRPNSNNNANLEAGVTAVLRLFWNEFKLENPKNRHDFSQSCMSCQHLIWFKQRDGVIDSNDRKDTAILNNSDGEAQMENLPYTEQAYCPVMGMFVDTEAVKELNEATAMQKELRVDGENNLEWEGNGEVSIGGRKMKIHEVRQEGTRERAENCLHYHGRGTKTTKQVSKERVSSNQFVSNYWSTRARAGRQVVQSLVDGEWETVFPYQAKGKVTNVRVKGIGVNVYVTKEIFENLDLTFNPEMEEFDANGAEFTKKVNMVFNAAFNRKDMTQDQFDEVLMMANDTPDDLSSAQRTRWENAQFWLAESLRWAIEREQVANRPDFMTKFYNGLVAFAAGKGIEADEESAAHIDVAQHGAEEINADDVISEILFKMEENGMEELGEYFEGSGKLTAPEFVRFLDDAAYDYVQEVLMDGTEFVVVGEEEKRHLVAGAMQRVLNAQVKRFTYEVGRAGDKDAQIEEFLKLKVCEDVLEYVAVQNDLLNK